MPHNKHMWITYMGRGIAGLLVLGLFVGGFVLFSPARARRSVAQADSMHAESSTGAQRQAFVVDGVLDNDAVDISSKLPGRLASIAVDEGDVVHAGQVVAVLQADELDAKQEQATAGMRAAEEQVIQGKLAVDLERNKAEDQVKQAQAGVEAATAALGMAKAKLAALEKGARPQEIEQAAQAVAAAQAAFDTAKKTNVRVQALADEGVIAQQKADEADMAYKSAQAQLAAAQAKLSLVRAGARPEEIDAARAQVRQSAAGVDAAQQTLILAEHAREMVAIRRQDVAAAQQKVSASRGSVNEVAAYQRQTRIVSPINGRVSQRMSRAGEIVAPGYAILSVARTDGYWVDVYVDESKFAGYRVGDMVSVEIPAVGQTVRGSISRVLPAADFATKRATNEKGTFDARAVQLRINLAGEVHNLASGLTARVHFAK